jgi:hypothetical protein
MARTNTLHGGIQHADNAGAEQRWVEIFADHVRRRFNSRALVRVRIAGGEAVELAYVYAIEGGSARRATAMATTATRGMMAGTKKPATDC